MDKELNNPPASGMVIVWMAVAWGLGGILAALLFVMGMVFGKWTGL